MILSALLIWFLSTEMLVNVVVVCFFVFFCFVFFVRKSLSYVQVKKYYSWFCSLIVVNLILSKYVITYQIAQTADVCKVMYITLPINSD